MDSLDGFSGERPSVAGSFNVGSAGDNSLDDETSNAGSFGDGSSVDDTFDDRFLIVDSLDIESDVAGSLDDPSPFTSPILDEPGNQLSILSPLTRTVVTVATTNNPPQMTRHHRRESASRQPLSFVKEVLDPFRRSSRMIS